MKIEELVLPYSNRLVGNYMEDHEDIECFFDYRFSDVKMFTKRVEHIRKRSYPREKLANHLYEYNLKFNPSEKTLHNIETLKDSNTVTVVGGQQAGVLTGPLYTIHKIISIIQLAKKQERELNVPVIPIFWIAGEDHDFAEINHAYIYKNSNMKKSIVPQRELEKESVSQKPIDYDKCWDWVQELVKSYGETSFSKELLVQLQECLFKSKSYVDFFAFLITGLFSKEGLVLVDSGNKDLRNIEGEFFIKLIENNEEIRDRVYKKQEDLIAKGYSDILKLEEENSHLFLHLDKERILLESRESNQFIGKNNQVNITKDELVSIANTSPERLSNNVVTRPLMQEYLFPTLAFISGPGEIAYWAALKEAFHLFKFEMPPVIPRLMMTMIDRKTEKFLQCENLSIQEVFSSNVNQLKENWIKKHQPIEISSGFTQAKKDILESHKKLQQFIRETEPALTDLAVKNGNIIENQVEYLQKVVENTQLQKYEAELKQFDWAKALLNPNGAPQERIWNFVYFINQYGFDFIDQLSSQSFEFNAKHKLVYI